ncbi:hypothetical protein HNE05_05130 [Aquipseudomonas campi]|uniref:Uncharacterized protein n=1 Tax=Aquipseudomonas campi TaxID=2731681 RepID=A0A6M8FRN1_9GAMM|nr:hypothetical protein [Pseudomonas campi]QKE62766.1 hypothetical protein HNE05_05130 [Pseudomonas campi]
MILKRWRDYKIEIRPLVILAGLLISPVIVILLLWLFSADGAWLDAFVWNKDTAPGWVQAIGAIIALIVAIGIAQAERKWQRWHLKDRVNNVRYVVCQEMYRVLSEIIFADFPRDETGRPRDDWKDFRYFEARVQAAIDRVGRIALEPEIGTLMLVSNAEDVLCELQAILRAEQGITRRLQDYAKEKVRGWQEAADEFMAEYGKHYE